MIWPLSSNSNNHEIERYDGNNSIRTRITNSRGTDSFYLEEPLPSNALYKSKVIEVTVQRGTKRIKHSLNSISIQGQTQIYPTLGKHVCDTCKSEIGHEISRIILMRDIDGGPHLLCFHFFFPCWDMELLCQKYPNLIIDKLRFSLPKKMKLKKESLQDLQNNLNFWK